MIVLLDLNFTIHLIKSRLGVKVITVIKSIMVNVMAQSCHQYWQGVLLIEISVVFQVLCIQYVAAMLCNIRTMEIIVICYISFVLIIDLWDKCQKFGLVDALEKIVLFKEWNCKNRHLHVSPNSFRELKNVKFKCIYWVIKALVWFNIWLSFFWG